MKKIYLIELFLVLALSLTGCGSRSYFEDRDAMLSAETEDTSDEEKDGEEAAGTEDASAKESGDTAGATVAGMTSSDSTGSGNDGSNASGMAGATAADSASSGDGASAEDDETASTVFVDVSGAVNRPGVYELAAGSRLFQAIEEAGGLSENADVTLLNRAEPVFDGQKVYVYAVGEERREELPEISGYAAGDLSGGTTNGALNGTSNGSTGGNSNGLSNGTSGSSLNGTSGNSGSAAAASSNGLTADGRIDLNTASKEQLMSLPGIGEKKADDIISYREEHGGFSSPEEIKNISGIKDGVYRNIADLIGIG